MAARTAMSILVAVALLVYTSAVTADPPFVISSERLRPKFPNRILKNPQVVPSSDAGLPSTLVLINLQGKGEGRDDFFYLQRDFIRKHTRFSTVISENFAEGEDHSEGIRKLKEKEKDHLDRSRNQVLVLFTRHGWEGRVGERSGKELADQFKGYSVMYDSCFASLIETDPSAHPGIALACDRKEMTNGRCSKFNNLLVDSGDVMVSALAGLLVNLHQLPEEVWNQIDPDRNGLSGNELIEALKARPAIRPIVMGEANIAGHDHVAELHAVVKVGQALTSDLERVRNRFCQHPQITPSKGILIPRPKFYTEGYPAHAFDAPPATHGNKN